MLRMPIESIAILLAKAGAIEIATVDADVTAFAEPDDADDEQQYLADDPSYRALTEAVAEMTPDELLQLLTLARLGDDEDGEATTWDAAAAAATAIPEDERVEQLLRALVLSDAIQSALEQLGYSLEGDDAADEDEDENER